ncbi:GntR family transcriptional regulator [Micromonospora sp. HNM0581]|uniref:GntR family transcriptional regulator n=1 Tax=Micromonospora sp. HNM0581 TaxID=2716341 RepID=UPI00146B8170|nr:GntR family transcriptional regulator [Micromonospora sp. HNM0581]
MPTPHYGQPRYRVIADELRSRIENGVIPPGTLLPTESALTVEFGVSRGTIRQAIAALREDHLVATEHGRGTYAKPNQREGELGMVAEFETQNRKVSADPELAALFAVETGTALLEQQTIARQNGRASIVVRTYRPLQSSL